MRKLAVLFAIVYALALLPHPSFAQIRNASFENWMDFAPIDPDWWTTFDNPYGGFDAVTISSDAYHGSKAARLEVLAGPYEPFIPYLYSFEDGAGHPVSECYEYVTGYYKFFPQNDGDSLFVVAAMLLSYTPVGAGNISLGAASDYTKFHVPIFYPGSETPNNVTVSFTIIGSSDTSWYPTVGTYALVDSIMIGPVATSVASEVASKPETFSLSQNYPNPFNPVTNIRFSILEPSDLKIEIYNIRGQRVRTLVDDHLQAGDHVVQWDSRDKNGRSAAAGIYFYRLKVGNQSSTKKMLLLR